MRRGAERICTDLKGEGFDAYLVGGSVRDRLLGRPVHEYDIATEATPDQVQKIFRRTHPVGAQFGVVIVVVDEGEYEVATFRAETSYSDGRRPDSVRFTSAREDVLRRDFTINGLLEDHETGEIRDFVHGERDLAARVIRAIGNPRERFAEDHLRVLRAIRFAAVLRFDIEAETFNAILEMAPRVTSVSVERIYKELSRAFTEGDPARAYTLLALSGVLSHVLPEALWLGANVAATLQQLGKAPFAAMLAAVLGDTTPEAAAAVAARLKASRADRDLLLYLVEGRKHAATVEGLANQVRCVREDRWPILHRLLVAERRASGADPAPIDALDELRRTVPPERLFPPRLLTGNDLMALGLKPGPRFKQLLHDLEDAQIEGEVATRDQAEAFVASH
ncbi:MAG: poly(A) polymerase [Myxococcota bacterium]|jgi:poly(A) polymerase